MMDINVLRGAIAAVSLATFAGIVIWAWAPRRKRGFDEAANLPFADDDRTGR